MLLEKLRSVLRNAGARRVAVLALTFGLGALAAKSPAGAAAAGVVRTVACAVGLSEVCE